MTGWTATDIADNSATATYNGINVDQTAPTISASVAPTPNANGWNDGSVTVHFTCSDATSGLASGACPADEIVSQAAHAGYDMSHLLGHLSQK